MSAAVRLLHVIDSLRPGGAERLLLTTVTHLDPHRYQHMVVVLNEPLVLKPDFDALGVPVHNLGVRGPYDLARGIVGMARVMRRWQPDLVHTHLSYSNFFGRIAAAVARVPLVVTSLHSAEYSHWGSTKLRTRMRKLVDALSARYLNDGLIGVSRTVCDDYRRHLGIHDVELIYNYVDVSAFPALAPESVAAARRALGWAPDDFILVHVGRLAWDKGQDTVVRALPAIARAIPNARVVFVGDGPKLDEFRALSTALGVADRVVFAGRQSSAHPLLGIADVFVFPSLAEGLGIALLEAMAMGLPVVASRTEGIAEVATHESDALLVSPQEPAALAVAVARLHDDPALASRLGAQAKRTVEERFGVNSGVAKLDQFYRRLAHAC